MNIMEMELEGISLDASCANVAFDIGGSLIKVACVEKKENENDSTIKLKTLNFSQFNDVVELLQKHLPDPGRITHINSTGVGVLKRWTSLENQLNIKIKSIDEMAMFVKSFLHLHQTMGEDLYYALDEDEIALCYQNASMMIEVMNSFLGGTAKTDEQKNTTATEVNPREELEKQFFVPFDIPKDLDEFLLVPCGSGAVVLKVSKDGTSSGVNILSALGKTFHSLATLMTGITSYEDILELAQKGNSENVNTIMKDLKCETPEPNFYNALPDHGHAYYFGKVHTQDETKVDFRKEDLLAGLLKLVCDNVCRICYETALSNGLHHVIFSGSFIDHPFVRKTMLNVWLTRATHLASKDRSVQILFPKYASYMGVIGALLTPTQ